MGEDAEGYVGEAPPSASGFSGWGRRGSFYSRVEPAGGLTGSEEAMLARSIDLFLRFYGHYVGYHPGKRRV